MLDGGLEVGLNVPRLDGDTFGADPAGKPPGGGGGGAKPPGGGMAPLGSGGVGDC